MSSSTATVTKNKKNWFMQFLYSSIGRKLLMALTGLFLILFLIVHLAGNLQLLFNDGGLAFNAYAEFMGHNEIIQLVSKGNFFFIVLHIIVSLVLTSSNAKARPSRYQYSKASVNSAWSSRNMMFLGSIVFIFLVVHIAQFYAASKGWDLGTDANGNEDLYTLVKATFAQPLSVALYVLGMIALGYHLSHGFQSAFQTIGLNHVKYNPCN